MSADEQAYKPIPLESVEIHPDYPGMLRLRDQSGAIWHYLQTERGELVLGRPYIIYHHPYKIHLFAPVQPYSLPSVLTVELPPGVQL